VQTRLPRLLRRKRERGEGSACNKRGEAYPLRLSFHQESRREVNDCEVEVWILEPHHHCVAQTELAGLQGRVAGRGPFETLSQGTGQLPLLLCTSCERPCSTQKCSFFWPKGDMEGKLTFSLAHGGQLAAPGVFGNRRTATSPAEAMISFTVLAPGNPTHRSCSPQATATATETVIAVECTFFGFSQRLSAHCSLAMTLALIRLC